MDQKEEQPNEEQIEHNKQSNTNEETSSVIIGEEMVDSNNSVDDQISSDSSDLCYENLPFELREVLMPGDEGYTSGLDNDNMDMDNSDDESELSSDSEEFDFLTLTGDPDKDHAMFASLMDDETDFTGGALMSANEFDEQSICVEPVARIPSDKLEELLFVGVVSSVVGTLFIVQTDKNPLSGYDSDSDDDCSFSNFTHSNPQATISDGPPALDLNNAIYLKDGTPIGRVLDVIGTINSPFYSVKHAAELGITYDILPNLAKTQKEKHKTVKGNKQKPKTTDDSTVDDEQNVTTTTTTSSSTTTSESMENVTSPETLECNEPKQEVAMIGLPTLLNYSLPPLNSLIQPGTAVYYCKNEAKFVLPSQCYVPGCDASNLHDEEIDAQELEFSDDEKEREHNSKIKAAKKKRQAKKKEGSAPQTTQPLPPPILQPPQYPNAPSYPSSFVLPPPCVTLPPPGFFNNNNNNNPNNNLYKSKNPNPGYLPPPFMRK